MGADPHECVRATVPGLFKHVSTPVFQNPTGRRADREAGGAAPRVGPASKMFRWILRMGETGPRSHHGGSLERPNRPTRGGGGERAARRERERERDAFPFSRFPNWNFGSGRLDVGSHTESISRVYTHAALAAFHKRRVSKGPRARGLRREYRIEIPLCILRGWTEASFGCWDRHERARKSVAVSVALHNTLVTQVGDWKLETEIPRTKREFPSFGPIPRVVEREPGGIPTDRNSAVSRARPKGTREETAARPRVKTQSRENAIGASPQDASLTHVKSQRKFNGAQRPRESKGVPNSLSLS